MREEVAPLLDRFLAGLHETLPPIAVWAHGSLAMGDFQPGRSDLDLIAVVESAPDGEQRQRLERLHKALGTEFPQAHTLHCSYMVRAELTDPTVRHLTWAHEEIMTRPVTAVSRRELHTGDLALFGPPPTELLPAVSDEELAAFVRADLRDFWLPATAHPPALAPGHLGRPRAARPRPRHGHPPARPSTAPSPTPEPTTAVTDGQAEHHALARPPVPRPPGLGTPTACMSPTAPPGCRTPGGPTA